MNRDEQLRCPAQTLRISLLLALALTMLFGVHKRVLAQNQWTTNGNNINNTNTGNVGIGTPNPADKLDVNGMIKSNTAVRVLLDGSDTIGAGPYFYLANAANTRAWAQQLSANHNIDYWFYNGTSWQRRITFDTSGNIGIGTSNPGSKLEISGSTFIQRLTNTDATTYGVLGFFEGTTEKSHIGIVGSSANPASYVGGPSAFQVWNVANAPIVFGTNSIERVRIDGSGSVGIGIASPNYKLDVQGGQINVSGGFCIAGDCKTSWAQVGGGGSSQWTTSGSNIFFTSGNAGIGTSTPQTKFHVYNGAVTLENAGPGVLQDSIIFATPGYPTTYLNKIQSAVSGGGINQLSFLVSDGTANGSVRVMTLDKTGNVGIGTTTPTKALTVVGDVEVSGSINAKYQDVAEWVPSSHKLVAGTVVVLDTGHRNQVTASTHAYDTKVAGVVSEQPGVILGEAGENKVKVATTGRVKVKVDATCAPINIGDLLVTSDHAGVAMKSEPLMIQGRPFHSPGTLIGKALEPLERGVGEILVLLSLQ